MTYCANGSMFQELLNKDHSVTIHQKKYTWIFLVHRGG